MNEQDQRNRPLRGLLCEGAVAFLPLPWLLLPAISQAALSFLVAAPVWFLGRCVFVDDFTAAGGACTWVPDLAGGQWLVLARILLLRGLLYVFLARLSVRRNITVPLYGRRFRLHRVYSVYGGLDLGLRIVLFMKPLALFSSFGRLITLPLGLLYILLWRVHLDLWAEGLGRRAFSPRQQIAVTARMMLYRQLRLRSPLEIEVEPDAEGLTVRGPLDAVDEERARDLIATGFTTPLRVRTETTLPEDLYWKSYREPLQRSGYESPPIPEPLTIPRAVPVSLGTVVLVLLWLALRLGPGLGIGITPEQIASFYSQQGLVPPQVAESLPQARRTLHAAELPDDAELIPDPVWLDIEGSLENCPSLGHTHWREMYYMELEGYVGPLLDPDATDDFRRYGDVVARIYSGSPLSYTLFAFDRATGICFLERRDSARARSQRYAEQLDGVLISEWKRVDRTMDWRHVPPVPLDDTTR